jgi:2-dehydro-3-deoxygalactonokinase
MERSHSILRDTLVSLFEELLVDRGLYPQQIDHACISGMATSGDGIQTVPHLAVPVSKVDIQKSLVLLKNPIFPIRTWLVPGVKTDSSNGVATPEEATRIQQIRGEEVEVFGVIEGNSSLNDCTVILTGSHTQIVFVKDRKIVDIFSNMSGELREAIIKNTILGGALSEGIDGSFNEEMVLLGSHQCEKYGINHALYGVRTMEVYSNATSIDKHSYFQGVLTSGVVHGLLQRMKENMNSARRIFVVGRKTEFDTYRLIFNDIDKDFIIHYLESDIVPYSVRGYTALMNCR